MKDRVYDDIFEDINKHPDIYKELLIKSELIPDFQEQEDHILETIKSYPQFENGKNQLYFGVSEYVIDVGIIHDNNIILAAKVSSNDFDEIDDLTDGGMYNSLIDEIEDLFHSIDGIDNLYDLIDAIEIYKDESLYSYYNSDAALIDPDWEDFKNEELTREKEEGEDD